jgi:hypothetical protein
MKQTTTEICIEVEEIVSVRKAKRNQASNAETKSGEKNPNPVIEICPHCGKAIFETLVNELKGEKKL